MEKLLYFLGIVVFACASPVDDQSPGTVFGNRVSVLPNLPTDLVGTYTFEKATLQGAQVDIIQGTAPPVVVEYANGSDITPIVKKILFGGEAFSSFQSMCHSGGHGIAFKATGKTSYVCLASSESMDMGTWNTTGAANALLAWNILNHARAIECEVVPYEVNAQRLEGYVIFPLPKDNTQPFLEGGNQQYGKILMSFKRVL